MKRIIGVSLLLLLGGCSASVSSKPNKLSSSQILERDRCDKLKSNKDELLKNSSLDYDQEIVKYVDPTARKKEEVRRSSWSFRALNYLMVQNPNCFEPMEVAWAQFWIDSFNRSEQVQVVKK